MIEMKRLSEELLEYFSNTSEEQLQKDWEAIHSKYAYGPEINQFIEECKMGLMYSLVKINNEIYELETQPDEVNSKKFDNFICYINEKEIKGVDNFLNYKFDNVHSLKDLKEISFLEYNNADPKKYFVEKTIDL